MRFLSVLIAVLVLALNCMPCSDAGLWAHEGNNKVTTATPNPAGHQDDNGTHQDLCSPFCQCACCSLAYALPLTLPQDTPVKTVWCDLQFPSWAQHCPSGITLPVWQPPQLV